MFKKQKRKEPQQTETWNSIRGKEESKNGNQYLPSIFSAFACIVAGMIFFGVIALFVSLLDQNIVTDSFFEMFFQSVTIASAFFMLANGAVLENGGIEISLIPLGASVVVMLIILLVSRIFRYRSLKAVVVASGVYAGSNFILTLFSDFDPSNLIIGAFRVIVYSFCMSFVCFASNYYKGNFIDRIASHTNRNRHRWFATKMTTLTVRFSLLLVVILFLISTIFTFVILIIRRDDIAQMLRLLNTNPLSTILFSIVCVMILPNIIIFNIGTVFTGGFSGQELLLNKVPLPILGGLVDLKEIPNSQYIQEISQIGLAILGIILVILMFKMFSGTAVIFSHRFDFSILCGFTIALNFVVLLIANWLSSGSITYGKLGYLGVDVLKTTFNEWWPLTCGMIFVGIILQGYNVYRFYHLKKGY
ncbi:MAG: DUF6350 family protein [Candidatus Ancillula sp.]|jgi:hypothetical protein|nr:DUF6350 family protein [Candidatus Ancillula sp.]